jgi:hypothetical protein
MNFLEDDLGELIGGPQYLNAVRDLFLREPDDQVFIWDLSHQVRSDILVGNQDFQVDNASWWITIVDPYRGRQPILLNRQFFLGGQYITFFPRLLLDSQVMNALHIYVRSPLELDPSRREVIRRFLSFVTTRNFTFDISPMFYLMETASKSNPENRELYMRERAETVFKLLTMDVQQFIQTGRIIPNPELQAGELACKGASSLDELVARFVEGKSDELAQECTPMVDFKYASLLKIALVQYQMRGDVLTKYYAIREFMDHTLGLVTSTELLLALKYFTHPQAQHNQRFIRPLQPKMRFENFRDKLRASAWDVWLIWLAHRVINMKTLDLRISHPCPLGYVCTADDALRDLMSSQFIIMIFGCRAGIGNVQPLLGNNLEMLGQTLGKDALHVLTVGDVQWQRSRLDDPKRKRQISADVLADVIAGLEAEAAAICKSGT